MKVSAVGELKNRTGWFFSSDMPLEFVQTRPLHPRPVVDHSVNESDVMTPLKMHIKQQSIRQKFGPNIELVRGDRFGLKFRLSVCPDLDGKFVVKGEAGC